MGRYGVIKGSEKHALTAATSDQTWPSRRKSRRLCGANLGRRLLPGQSGAWQGALPLPWRKIDRPEDPRLVVRASPRPSACGGDIIERGIGKLVPLRRNAITSDAVTRVWRRLSEAAAAHRPKPTVNEGRCRSNNGSIPPTTQTEARPSWRRTPPARECPSVAVRPAVQCWRLCRFPGRSQHGGVPTPARQPAGIIQHVAGRTIHRHDGQA